MTDQAERTNRTRMLTTTFLNGKEIRKAPEWSDKPNPGLRIRITPKGRMSWFYRYRLDGRLRKISIGS